MDIIFSQFGKNPQDSQKLILLERKTGQKKYKETLNFL